MTILKKFIMTGLIGAFVILFNTNVYSLINNNGAGGGYGGGGGESLGAASTGIDYYITEGAGYYLAANTAVQELLQMVELRDTRGIDPARLDTLLHTAAGNMKNALGMYDKLLALAAVTPYDPAAQTALKNFDYDGFALQNGLNAALFDEVKGFLKKGDITGTLKWTHSRFNQILGILDSLNEGMSTDGLPDISALRRLNETLSETSIFGSCTARIFSSLFY